MSTARKIFSNTVAQIMGRAVMAGLSIVILKTVATFLTADGSVGGYGQYSTVYEFLAFFGIIADLGLFTISVREMSKGERERSFIFTNILGMRMVLAGICMLLAVILAFIVPQYQGTFVPMGVVVASFAVFLAIVQGTLSSALQVEHKMQHSSMALVLSKLVTMLWMLATVYVLFKGEAPSQAAFNQLMFAGVAGNLFALLYTAYFVAKIVPLRPAFDKAYWREIVLTAAPYGFALVLNMIYFRIDGILISVMRGFDEAAYYGPPMRILEILSVLPVYFMNSVLPVLTIALRSAEGKAKAKKMLGLSFDVLYGLGLPIMIGLSLLAYPLIFLVADPDFLSRLDEGVYGSDIALQILAVAMFFSYLNSLFNYTLIAVGKQNALLWINGSACLFNIGVNLWAIPQFGFRGAAVVTVLTEVFVLLAAAYWSRRFLDFSLNWGRLLKMTLCAGLMGWALLLLKEPSYGWLGMQNWNVFFLSGVGALIYGFGLLILRALPERKSL
jgi:O-antigen/teichoic acid export membrane protein